jgi:anti-sigma B factor antagonist
MVRNRALIISSRVVRGTTIVDLQGTIDLGNSPTLRTSLFETLQAVPRLALNMSRVEYIDSSGIATLIEVFKKARDLNKGFVLFGLSGAVHDVLKLTNLLGVFRIFDSEEHALAENTAS